MPKIDLPDINVWLSLIDENHVHHKSAAAYWESTEASRIVFCRATMLGFFRLTMNREIMKNRPYTPSEAWAAYRNLRKLPEIGFLTEPEDLESKLAGFSDTPSFKSSLWTDAYLATFASLTHCRIVSFDRDFQYFPKIAYLQLKA